MIQLPPVRLGTYLLTSLILLLAGLVFPAHAADIDVLCTVASLTTAITTSSSGDTLHLSPGCTYALTSAASANAGLPDIDKTLTIDGNGATITRNSGSPAFRLFYVAAAGNLTLSNMTLSNGSDVFGGAVQNLGTLTVNGSLLTDNTSSALGGAIHNDGGTVTVSGSNFSGNSSMTGGALRNSGGTTTITDTTLNGNLASSEGGALAIWGGTITLERSTVSGNTSSADGGGILVYEGTVNVRSSTIADNSAVFNGGGIYNYSGNTVAVSNSTVSGNSSGHIGGLLNLGTMLLGSTIVADNSGGDLFGTFSSLGYNAITNTTGATLTGSTATNLVNGAASPLNLHILADNGGATPTMKIGVNSVAIGAGSCSTLSGIPAVTVDQRSLPRKSPCDIGAYENQGGSISGHVYETNGVTPVSGNVWVDAEFFSTGQYLGTSSVQLDGSYRITGVPEGDYRLRSLGDGYALDFYQDGGASRDFASPVSVTAQTETPNIDFTLDPAGTISGTVYAEDGISPLENITVNVQQYGDGRDISVGACTDSSGSYTLYNLPRNVPLVIIVLRDGNNWCGGSTAYAREYWQDTLIGNNATPITLTNGTPDVTGIDFVLELGGTISGHIFQTDGATPITNGAWVNVQPVLGDFWIGSGVQPDGSYTITGIPPGQHRVRGEGAGYAIEYFDEAGGNGENATLMTISGGTVLNDVDFTLDPAGTISGTVFAEDGTTPLPGILVRMNEVWSDACTDADGNYTIYGLPLDTPLKLIAGGSHWCGNNDYIEEFWQDATNPDDATAVTLTAGTPDVTGIDFSLSLGGRVSGHVFESDGVTPISGANVSVEHLDGSSGSGTSTGADGSYLITGLSGGDYRARSDAPGFAVEFYDNAGGSGDFATSFTVVPGSEMAGIDFTLDPGGNISGTVYEADGLTPIPNMRVDVEGYWAGQCTDANGKYTVYNMPLNVVLKINAGGTNGENWCAGGSQDYPIEWWQESDTSEAASGVMLTLATPNATGIDFTLSLGGRISGHVFQSDGVTPISGANIWVDLLDGSRGYGSSTGADGSYLIVGLPGGDYRARSDAPGYAVEFYDNAGGSGDFATPVTITSGSETSGIDFTLDPGGNISGTVYEADGMTPIPNMRVDVEGYWAGQCTDVNGSYTVYNMPLNVVLKINAGGPNGDNWCAGGSQDYPIEWWQESPTPQAASGVTLTSGAPNATGIDFTLAVGGKTSGHVYQSGGTTPISGAWVWVEHVDGSGGYGTITGADGSYLVTGLSGGDYRARAEAAGFAVEFYDNAGGNGDFAASFAVTPGSETMGIDFTLDPGGNISGTVYEADGMTPIPNMRVDVDGYWVGQCTDSNGSYTLYSLPFDVVLKINAGGPGGDNWCDGGSQDYPIEWWEESDTPEAASGVTLTSGAPNAAGIDFTLQRGGRIAGTATAAESGAPLADVWLCAFDYGAATFDVSPPWRCTQTASDGTYTLFGVVPGSQRVWIFPEDRLRLFYDQSNTFAGADAVAVTAGSTTSGIDFSLPLAGIITGHVYDENGDPLSGVTISLADGTYPECSQSDGSYRIWVPAGTHTIKAEQGMCSGAVTFATQYYNLVPDIGSAVPVTINLGETIPNIDFSLQERIDAAVTLQGRPTPPDPLWVTTVHVTIMPSGGGAAVFDGGVVTDQYGHFLIDGIAPGSYSVFVNGDHTLVNEVMVTLHFGVNAVSVGTLREGDADGNDKVNISDFAILALTFGKTSGQPGYDGRADFNGDGAITILDFSLLALNFGQTGAAP